MRKPWYWKQRRGWYLDTDEGRILLGDSEAEAYAEWDRMKRQAEKERDAGPTFQTVYAAYLKAAWRAVHNGELEPKSLEDYISYGDRFAKEYGEIHVSELAPFHVSDWIGQYPSWGPSAQRNAITSISRILNWAATERRIPENPIKGMKKPKQPRRQKLISNEEHKRMVLKAGSQKGSARKDRQFRLVLIAIRHCGGRPQDVANVRIEHVDQEFTKWVIPEHKTKKHTDRPRQIFLSPCLATISRMLAAGRESGPLFRGRSGAITTNAITCRVKRLKEQLKISDQIVFYSYRHTYITDALKRGIGIATVAELTGTSVKMIQDHYGHLSQHEDHLRNAALDAVKKNA